MALACIRHLGLSNPIVIGGRATAGPNIQCAVEDDGCWSIERTCILLKAISDRVPTEDNIALYLPHTAMLFGKLLKLSGRVERIYYLEEGYTSANRSFLHQVFATTQVDLPSLTQALQDMGLIESWQMYADALACLNETPEIPFDAHCEKYAGCFACTPNAFAGMPSVTLVKLEVELQRRPVSIVAFYGILNKYGREGKFAREIDACCQMVLNIAQSIQAASPPDRTVLVKLHPNDCLGLPAWFYAALRSRSADYFEYCRAHQIDANLEPALLNFEHYHIFGETAQTKYVQHFLGANRLTQYENRA
jgi:hypothetical protein